MGRNRSPGSRASATRRQTVAAISAHPRVAKHLNPMSDQAKLTWAQNTFGNDLNEADIKAALHGVMVYSGSAYSIMRNDADDPRAKAVDKMLENPKAPVYDGEIYRGVDIRPKKR